MKRNVTEELPDIAAQPLDFFSERFMLSDDQFQSICQLIYQKAGIVLTNNKREMVYNRLTRRLRELRMNNFGDYLAFLKSDVCNPEWQEFINALTTNLTAFFREAHHFPILAKHAKNRVGGVYRVWCAAASTGEEPYSIAMTLRDVFGDNPYKTKIIASDIDTNVLEKARKGVYRLEELKTLNEEYLKKYFLKGVGDFAGYVKIRPQVSEMVTFQYLNLLDKQWKLEGPFDAIFCRNVMIYFDKTTQQSLLHRFIPLLKPDGMLFVGHSENVSQLSKDFYLQGHTVYGLTPARRGYE
ncbi:protein-glutamate O-methyltransferase CheR [Proteus mirabilis]